MKKVEFITKNLPDKETEINFHTILAKALINKHGVDVMKEVVKVIKSKDI